MQDELYARLKQKTKEIIVLNIALADERYRNNKLARRIKEHQTTIINLKKHIDTMHMMLKHPIFIVPPEEINEKNIFF